MRNIQKGREPRSLTTYKQTINACYNDYRDMDTLRQYLFDEQGGICCYCMSRIRPAFDGMKVEHWQCRDNYSGRQLDYSNMLGACLGGKGKPQKDQHCDTKKENKDLSINPADPAYDVEHQIKFLGNGKIKSDNVDIHYQLNSVLNLNHHLLVSNRKSLLDAFQDALRRGKISNLRLELTKWNGSRGEILEPFSQVVVYYIKKKIGRGV